MTAQKYEYQIIGTYAYDFFSTAEIYKLGPTKTEHKMRDIHEETINTMAKAGWEAVNLCYMSDYHGRESLLRREYKA